MVVRVKDRFKHPSGGGWRDVMINFYVVGDGAKHVCEVQLVHKSLLTARKGLPGHVIYGVVRNATEVLEFLGLLSKLERGAGLWALVNAGWGREAVGSHASRRAPSRDPPDVAGAAGQGAHLLGHHGEALAVLAGPGRFHRSVQRQDIGLEGDAVDQGDDFVDLGRGGADLLHGAFHLAHGLLTAPRHIHGGDAE